VERHRQVQQSVEQLNERVGQARRAFPEEAELELSELERQIAALREAPTPESLRERLATLGPAGAERPLEAPPIDISSAAERSGLGLDRLHELLAPLLPLYLRTLSGGFLREARHVPDSGWRLLDENGAEVGIEGLPPVVGIAVRCALVEALARIETACLVVGPALDGLDLRSRDAVSRAFRRLGSMVQVVHVSLHSEPWASRAMGVALLGVEA
jgi:hypothetical protein